MPWDVQFNDCSFVVKDFSGTDSNEFRYFVIELEMQEFLVLRKDLNLSMQERQVLGVSELKLNFILMSDTRAYTVGLEDVRIVV